MCVCFFLLVIPYRAAAHASQFDCGSHYRAAFRLKVKSDTYQQ